MAKASASGKLEIGQKAYLIRGFLYKDPPSNKTGHEVKEVKVERSQGECERYFFYDVSMDGDMLY
jgi:hypothetical protein